MKVFLHILIALLFTAPLQASDRSLQGLAQQLQSPETALRRQAVLSLGRIGSPQSVLLLRRALQQEPQVAIRLQIVSALRTIVFLRYSGYPQALPALADAADDALETDELVRLRANQALWEAAKKTLLDPTPILARNLEDRSLRLRLSAVRMLAKLGTPATIEPLGSAALDKTQPAAIRLKAIEALGSVSLSDPGPVGRQVSRANIRTTQLLGLPPLESPAALELRHRRQIQYLAAVVDDLDNSSTLMLRAVKSMGQVKDKSSIPTLNRIAETHPEPAIRKHAMRVLSSVLARQYE